MYREPHTESSDMKVWLSVEAVKQFLSSVEDATKRIVFASGCGRASAPRKSATV
jgi:hypothetical protein